METNNKTWHTIIIGAGQAGLATGFYLKNLKKEFLIFDENIRIGDVWRKRWDSLKLFTPAQYDGLPGMPFQFGLTSGLIGGVGRDAAFIVRAIDNNNHKGVYFDSNREFV